MNEFVIQFKNYAPDFNLDTVSQSEKYLDILLVLKEIQEFAISTNIKKTFEFNIRNFDETYLEKIEIRDIQLIIKYLSNTIELLSKINNPIKEKDIYYQINILNKLLKDIELIKNQISDQYIGRKLNDKELLQIKSTNIKIIFYEGLIKNKEIFSRQVKSILFKNNLSQFTVVLKNYL